jgi:hypothetical protein
MKRQNPATTLNLLSLSDIPLSIIHSAQAAERFRSTDLILGCGDLSYEYMEYVISRLDVPLYYVRGNHSKGVEYGSGVPLTGPQGGIDLHRRTANYRGLLLAGIEGCIRYRPGPYQYSQSEMWGMVYLLAPALLFNRAVHGRYLDVFVTHAPPWGIHDEPDDTPHQGVKAFRWFLRVFKPAYHFHGHIHIYHPDTVTETVYECTRVINTFGYRETTVEIPSRYGK